MNPAYIALISSVVGGLAAIIVPILVNWFSRDNRRADAAKSFQEVASDAAGDIRELRAEVRGIRTALEGLTRAVEAAIPLLETEHPETAEKLREAHTEARAVI